MERDAMMFVSLFAAAHMSTHGKVPTGPAGDAVIGDWFKLAERVMEIGEARFQARRERERDERGPLPEPTG